MNYNNIIDTVTDSTDFDYIEALYTELLSRFVPVGGTKGLQLHTNEKSFFSEINCAVYTIQKLNKQISYGGLRSNINGYRTGTFSVNAYDVEGYKLSFQGKLFVTPFIRIFFSRRTLQQITCSQIPTKRLGKNSFQQFILNIHITSFQLKFQLSQAKTALSLYLCHFFPSLRSLYNIPQPRHILCFWIVLLYQPFLCCLLGLPILQAWWRLYRTTVAGRDSLCLRLTRRLRAASSRVLLCAIVR